MKITLFDTNYKKKNNLYDKSIMIKLYVGIFVIEHWETTQAT